MKITVSGISAVSNELERSLELLVRRLAETTEAVARKNTPKDTGRARAAWKTKKTKTDFTVENRVPYIERLEAGASKQAPKGIIGPTLTQVKGKIR